jgi:heptaprenyl diphosphate synthase
MNVKALYGPVGDDLKRVDALIAHNLTSTRLPKLLEINTYLLGAPGKRLRPVLCLLAYSCLAPNKPIPQRVIQIAAALEMLHMASLIHDDVIDHAEVRHNQPTVHTKWGQETAIPLGVYLYSLSLKEIANAANTQVLRRISHTVKILCEGEMNQVFERGNSNLDLKRYLLILKKKTAILFATACYSGALLSGASKQQAFALKHAGHCLGMLFQISDDILDVVGTDQTLGKKVGQDFEMGEITLPFLCLLEELPLNEKQEFQALIESRNKEVFSRLLDRLKASTALEKSAQLGRAYIQRAKDHLSTLESSPSKDHFLAVVDMFEARFRV